MKQQAFSKILLRLAILKANIIYTFRIESAYFANNWGNVFSTTFYTISNILFIDIMYSNVRNVAGYSRDEMLLFMFVGQVSYYLSWTIHGNIQGLIDDVRGGELDLVLVKPVPALFFVTFKKVSILSIVRDCVPPMLVIALVIHWDKLSLTPLNVIAGTFVCFLGIVSSQVIHFISALPVFWVGQSDAILSMSQDIEYNIAKIVPLEGFGKKFQIFFTAIIPYLISGAVATSVVLGKLPAITTSFIVFLITVIFLFLKQFAWNSALKAYASASS